MRPLYLLLGLVCVGLGYIGIIVPGMPSTVFFLIALWSFKRSSPRLEDWLLYKTPFGPALQDWDRERSMTRRNRTLALTMLWLGISASTVILVLRHRPWWVTTVVVACGIGVTVFLLGVKIKMSDEASGKSV